MQPPDTAWDTIAIIGVGLIGGSIGLATRRRKIARRVIGIGRNDAKLSLAMQHGAISDATTEIATGVADAQLVIVCTPVDWIVPYATSAAASCPDGAIITDAGSTKQSIVASMSERSLGESSRGIQFIGSHPLAGSDQSGVEHARENLLDGRVVVITPTRATNPTALNKLSTFWELLGARVMQLSPQSHDAAVATTSHVPHVVASSLATATPLELAELLASGWSDTTRIAAADPELWQQILLDNQTEVLKSLDRFAESLESFREAIADKSESKLKRLLQQGKQRRDALGS